MADSPPASSMSPDDQLAVQLLQQGLKNIQDHTVEMAKTFLSYETVMVTGKALVQEDEDETPATTTAPPKAS